MSAERRAAMREQYPLMNFPNAASSLITTAGDYARFMVALSKPGWLSDNSIKQLQAPLVDAGKGIQWGLVCGLVHSRARGAGLWQWGDFGVFQHFALTFPLGESILVSLTSGARGQRFNKDVARLCFREDLACFPWLKV